LTHENGINVVVVEGGVVEILTTIREGVVVKPVRRRFNKVVVIANVLVVVEVNLVVDIMVMVNLGGAGG